MEMDRFFRGYKSEILKSCEELIANHNKKEALALMELWSRLIPEDDDIQGALYLAKTVCARTQSEIEKEIGEIRAVIGTQMITKGLNFENVTLVGVLNADQSLYVGDYRANERTFSLITQVIGRSGRGDAPGRAVIQTFTPANETIQQAARQDYDAFYRSEIRLRKLNGTPPFSEVLAVTVSGAQENAVVRCCAYIRDYFRQTVGERAEVLGPAPLPVVRMNNRYRYRVTLYCNQSKAVRRAAANIVMYCNTEKSFRDVTVFADDNPLD